MFSHKVDAPPSIRVPAPAADRPSWVKVGSIAALGLVIGIAWPRLAGVKLGPSAPEVSSAARAAREAPVASAVVAPVSSAPVAPPTPTVAPVSPTAPKITIARGYVLSCKHKEGETLKTAACGAFAGFDTLAQPRLKKLEQCAAADGVSGKLALVFNVDFATNHIGIDVNRSSTVQSPEPLVACVRNAFQGAAIATIEHEHPKYAVLFNVTLESKGGATPAASGSAVAKEGEDVPGQVQWETALVRDVPKTGAIVARLPRGTKIKIGAGTKDGWYKIKFGADLTTEGFVYRGAIGK